MRAKIRVEKSRDKIQRTQKNFSHEGTKDTGKRISENQDIRE
jgi:hypothetical protein